MTSQRVDKASLARSKNNKSIFFDILVDIFFDIFLNMLLFRYVTISGMLFWYVTERSYFASEVMYCLLFRCPFHDFFVIIYFFIIKF